MNKYKILQICDRTHDYVQGFDLSEEIVRALVQAGHEVTFGVLTGVPDAGLSQRIGCPVEAFRFSKRQLKPTSWTAMLRLIRYIRTNRFDVVITHRFKPWLMLAVAAIFLPQCRFAAVFHAFKQFDRRRRQWLATLLLNGRWRFVAVSRALKADLVKHGIPEQRICIIKNAIDAEGVRAAQLSREEAREQLNLPANKTVIGTLGRCKTIKGQRYLVDAFARIAIDWPDTILVIIGGGEEEAALKKQAATYDLQQRIIITGSIVNASRLLRALDIFVLPSLSEGLGLAMLEAIATPLPVIGTRAGGLPEAVGEHGVLVEPANSAELAAAIDKVLRWSKTQREDYQQILQRHLFAEFSIEHYHRRCRELVDELMAISLD